MVGNDAVTLPRPRQVNITPSNLDLGLSCDQSPLSRIDHRQFKKLLMISHHLKIGIAITATKLDQQKIAKLQRLLEIIVAQMILLCRHKSTSFF